MLYENNMAVEVILRFYGFRVPGKHVFSRSPWSKQHFHSPKPLPFVCAYQHPAQAKAPTFDKVAALYWLHSRSGRASSLTWVWASATTNWGKMTQVLIAIAQNPHERYLQENWSASTRLKFYQNNSDPKELTASSTMQSNRFKV